MTGDEGRTLEVPLAFLGPGTWRARIWKDAPDAAFHPEKAVEQTRTVGADESLSLVLAPAGGQAVIFEPAP
jgi:alpha-glucosidase